jgi:hypothetical protein
MSVPLRHWLLVVLIIAIFAAALVGITLLTATGQIPPGKGFP